jgi:hypothetical protein
MRADPEYDFPAHLLTLVVTAQPLGEDGHR